MMKPFVVANPAARRADIQQVRQLIDQHLSGLDYEIYQTTGDEKIAEVVAKAIERGFDLIIAAGGDGTVSAVAAGLVNSNTPMAILPIGTGNVLARELGISMDLDEAIQMLVGESNTSGIDGMWGEDWLSVLSVGVGFTSLTMQATDQEEKRRFGVMAYIWNGLIQLSGVRRHRFLIEVDGVVECFKASEIYVSNTRVIGMKPFMLGSEVRADDGAVEVYIVAGRTVWDYLRVGVELATGRRRRKELDCYRAHDRVKISCKRQLPVQVDGEIVGSTPVEVTVVPAVVGVVVPK